MKKCFEFFVNTFTQLAGFYGDKTILSERGISSRDMEYVAEKLGYKYFDNGNTFVVSRAKYC